MRWNVTNAVTFRLLRVFAGNRRGVAAVEFALVLPLMLALYLGCVEFSQAYSLGRQVTLIASTAANLTGRSTTLTTSGMTDILNASGAIISPYSANSLAVTVSCLSISSTGAATVSWSATLNGTARTTGSTVAIPSALAAPSSKLIFSEVSYPYTPNLGYIITGTLNLADHMYQSPRISAPVYNSIAC
jgi:Flp pilus assembly protein TadG